MPRALPVELAILTVALGCIALGVVESGRRWALVVAGAALVLAATFRYEPASAELTLVHRLFAGIAVSGIVVASFLHGRFSRALGAAELALIAATPALVATPFDAWGLWERCLLGLQLAWMTGVSARSFRVAWMRVSTDEIASATTASISSNAS